MTKLTFLRRVDSTNLEWKRRLNDGEKLQGAGILIAYEQTGGRGRQGRKWHSPPGNLYISLAEPLTDLRAVNHQALLKGIVVYEAVETYLRARRVKTANLTLKWPNDLLWAEKKLAGILLETVAHPNGEQYLISGMGLNVAHAPDNSDHKTAAINAIISDQADAMQSNSLKPEKAIKDLAHQIRDQNKKWSAILVQENGEQQIRDAWQQRAHPVGSKVKTTLKSAGEKQRGTFKGLSESGAAIIEFDGVEKSILAGDLFLES